MANDHFAPSKTMTEAEVLCVNLNRQLCDTQEKLAIAVKALEDVKFYGSGICARCGKLAVEALAEIRK